MKGEEKKCATSLESMVESSMEKLGTRDVIAVSTTRVDYKETQDDLMSLNGVERMKGKRMMACHSEAHAYTVFYCHAVEKTGGYRVRIEGEVVMEAVAVCHMDMMGWNKEHLAFKVLKVKPKSVPVCHFLPEISCGLKVDRGSRVERDGRDY